MPEVSVFGVVGERKRIGLVFLEDAADGNFAFGGWRRLGVFLHPAAVDGDGVAVFQEERRDDVDSGGFIADAVVNIDLEFGAVGSGGGGAGEGARCCAERLWRRGECGLRGVFQRGFLFGAVKLPDGEPGGGGGEQECGGGERERRAEFAFWARLG